MIRIFDILISAIGIILLIPLFLIIALLNYVLQGAPVFYLQDRVGKNEKIFRIIKFRTMKTNGKNYMKITLADDNRVTKFGRILRKYKLDELPQLVNVLLGNMSMVGPRPEVPKYIQYYLTDRKLFFSRKPGITDFASIVYRNESNILSDKKDPETYYVEILIPKKISLNMEFITNPSIFNYFKVIYLTILAIFRK